MKKFFCIATLIAFSSIQPIVKISPEAEMVLQYVQQFLPSNPVVLEAGAYDCSDSLLMTKIWPNAVIHAFEPIPQLFAKIKQRTSMHENIHSYCLALGNKIEKADFYCSYIFDDFSEPSHSSSLLKPKEHLMYAPHVSFNDTVKVQVTTIDNWAKMYGVDHIDFMWLDMQGGELDALMAAEEILKTVKVIYTEVEYVEAYEGQFLFDDVFNYLESKGFALIAMDYLEGENWTGNAVFLNVN
jgi:2-O-methyltransferase